MEALSLGFAGHREFKRIHQPDIFRIYIAGDENAVAFMVEVSPQMVGSHNYVVQMVAEFSGQNPIDEFFVLRHDKGTVKALRPSKSTQKGVSISTLVSGIFNLAVFVLSRTHY
jgi:hypothetical protein